MNKFIVAATSLAAFAAAPAVAGTFSVGTDRAAFEASLVAPFTVEEFGDVVRFPISTGVLNSLTDLVVEIGPSITPGLIKPGVTYSTPVGSSFFFNIDAGGGFDGGLLDGFYGGDPQRRLTVTFDAPVAAFGFDTNAKAPNLEVIVRFSDLTTQTYTTTVSGLSLSFYGFSSPGGANIVSATIGGNNNGTFAFALDNFTFAAVVPEPGTYALMLLGLAGVVGAARRR